MTRELVFVYLGPKLPVYGHSSLVLAARHSGLEVTLIGEHRIRNSLRRGDFRFLELESFYDREAFGAARKNLLLDQNFRNGFWVHALERLFVLEQYAQKGNLSSVFHAELDQLLFGVDELVGNLSKLTKKGVYFPFHSADKAVASLFFFNDRDALRSLLNKASTGTPFANEMELLVNWATESPDRVIRLPTLGDLAEPHRFQNLPALIPVDSCGGLIDAAELGLWVGGRDPRNLELNQRPRTKYTYPQGKAVLPPELLRKLRFELQTSPTRLWVSLDGNSTTFRLYNLHLHSKTHPWIAKFPGNLRRLLNASNSDASIIVPGARFRQLQYVVLKKLSRRHNRTVQLAKRWGRIIGAEVSKFSLFLRRFRKQTAGLAIKNGFLRSAQIVSPSISEKALVNALLSYQDLESPGLIESVKGKRVLLVGPAQGEIGREDLADFDFVARLGFTGEGSSPDGSSTRCDLSFLARWHAEALTENLKASDYSPPKTHFLLRYDVTEDQRKRLGKSLNHVSDFPTEPCDRIFAKVIPNFAPQVIMFLLSCSPAELKVSNIDLMTSTLRPVAYATNKEVVSQDEGWTYPAATMRRSFAQFHNPFTHFSFFKRLRDLDGVSFSPGLSRIIDNGLSSYRERLRHLYFSR